MKDEKKFLLEFEHDALAQPTDLPDALVETAFKRRIECSQEKGTRDADALKCLPDQKTRQGLYVNLNIGKFRHMLAISVTDDIPPDR
jgi:hypothetical protein